MSFELNRKQYSALYGPTIGDSVRLADTELFATVEKDLTVPGEEALFGGGKVIRADMGQDGERQRHEDVPDVVITNVLITPEFTRLTWPFVTRTFTASARPATRKPWTV